MGMLLILVPMIFYVVLLWLLPPELAFGSTIFGILSTLVVLVFTVLFVSLLVRRFHDRGSSGWRTLTLMIPVVNGIIFLYLFLAKSEEGENKYGKPLPNGARFFDVIFDCHNGNMSSK
jgi:uncharacterized membrane protein YhaH (DUF805 family)